MQWLIKRKDRRKIRSNYRGFSASFTEGNEILCDTLTF